MMTIIPSTLVAANVTFKSVEAVINFQCYFGQTNTYPQVFWFWSCSLCSLCVTNSTKLVVVAGDKCSLQTFVRNNYSLATTWTMPIGHVPIMVGICDLRNRQNPSHEGSIWIMLLLIVTTIITTSIRIVFFQYDGLECDLSMIHTRVSLPGTDGKPL